MLTEYSTQVEQILLHYDVQELNKWKSRNKELVPERYLNHKGPGISNGYHYGEFVTKRYFESIGYLVFDNDYNFSSNKSMYESNNRIIIETIGDEIYNKIHAKINQVDSLGIKIKEPDLIVIKPSMFFVEVNKDNDHIQPGQDTFAIMIQNLFNIPFKVCRVLPSGHEYDTKPLTFIRELPSEVMI